MIKLVYCFMSLHNKIMELNVQAVKKIVSSQFPHFANHEISMVYKSGHDNRTFHLGNEFSLRFPSAIEYSTQVLKEHQFCSILQSQLSVQITEPFHLGKPSDLYPFHFSINKWIEGESINHNCDKKRLAFDCAKFLLELKACDTINGIEAGKHNFYRGGNLSVYHEETLKAIHDCTEFDQEKCYKIWNKGITSTFHGPNSWIHGDFEKDNILVKNGRLHAVIDFGNMAVGDPACDYVMAWTYFDEASREIFLKTLNIDNACIARAKAWALWKALITLSDPKRRETSLYTLNEIFKEDI